MEPLDPAKNDENSGFYRRRISSILKAPRKSVKFPDPEQREVTVECTKPVEKRISRRVSFAPANDVLLFSKDVKNASPTRSPLQELLPTAVATQNGVQVAGTDDGTQQIWGMETLLNAPLHASQQRDKVNFSSGDDFGERTVMFSDDALMDMTQSHTINIAGDEELCANFPQQNRSILPPSGEKTKMFTPDDASIDKTLSHTMNMTSGSELLSTGRNVGSSLSSQVPSFDPGFSNFLASLSKPVGSNVNPTITRTTHSVETNNSQFKTQGVYVDKENQAPSLMEKLLSKTSNIGESTYGKKICPEVDVNMDMTEAHTGRIMRPAEDDDPFQCLFPTQEMYSCSGRASQTAVSLKTLQQQGSQTKISSDPKEVAFGNRVQMMTTVDGSQKITDVTSRKNPPLHASHLRHQGDFDRKKECTEKTTRFTADDAFMDLTRSHTVNIKSLPLAPGDRKFDSVSGNGLDAGFKNFLESLSKPNGPGAKPVIAGMFSTASVTTNSSLVKPKTQGADVQTKGLLNTTMGVGLSSNGDTICDEDEPDMDMTEAQTGRIIGFAGMDSSVNAPLKTTELRHQVQFDAKEDCREKTLSFIKDNARMDLTQSHTVNLLSDIEPQTRQNLDFLPAGGEKTVRFSAADAAMDVTRSHTVNIAAHFEPQTHQNPDFISAGGEKTVRFSAADAGMDVTRSHTVNIAAHFEPQAPQNLDFLPTGGEKTVRFDAAMDVTRSHTVNIAAHFEPQKRQNLDFLTTSGEKTLRFNAADAAMDVTRSHTVNIAAHFEPQAPQNLDFLPAGGEKTVRFNAADAAMDVTRSHTVNIAAHFEPQTHQNVDFLPTGGEKTVRFSAADAAMDVTRSHTVNIAAHFEPQRPQNLDFIPTGGEKTVRFNAADAAMDVTRSHTVNIAAHFEPQKRQNLDFLTTTGEKTLRFNANDAAMDVTKSHTVNIAAHFEPQAPQNLDFLPTGGEKTVRFTANDAAMDVTRSHTVNILSDMEPQSLQNVDVLTTSGEKTVRFPANDAVNPANNSSSESVLPVRKQIETCVLPRNRSSSGHSLGFRNSLSRTSLPWAYPMINRTVAPAVPESVETNGLLTHIERRRTCVEDEHEAAGVLEKSVNKPTKIEESFSSGHSEEHIDMEMTEAQTGFILRERFTDEPSQGLSSSRDSNAIPEHLKETEVTAQQNNEATGRSSLDVEITSVSDSLDSNENMKEPNRRNETSPLSKKLDSPGAVHHNVDSIPAGKSRRMSLADLQSKVRRLSHMIQSDPDTIDMHSRTAQMPQLDPDLEEDNDKSPSALEPEATMGFVNPEDDAQGLCPPPAEQALPTMSTTPFKLKTKELMSRLSVGGFKAKLPQKRRTDNPKKADSSHANNVGEDMKTITLNVGNNLDPNVSDINDEELGSYEDLSETLDTKSPQKIPSIVFDMDEILEDDVFKDDVLDAAHGKKRRLQDDEMNMEDEKRMKVTTETVTGIDEMGLQSHDTECGGNMTTAPNMNTQTIDSSNHTHTTSLRCEATFESTLKQSMFESQLEDYASDIQEKLDDGTLTVSEFFKLFNIDFVIHNPRQSVLPGRIMSDTAPTPMDLLKHRHITRPKQLVYEANVLNLEEKVEGLKIRMQDLDKPLRIINRPLWEEMTNLSEKELKTFGAKLKERNNFFRKMSKAQSHEMKEVLYSDLLQVNMEEQQKLRGTIEEADEMIKCLDDCISELETELAAIEEKGVDNKPSLKSSREGLKEITETLADNNRQISEVEIQKKQSSSKLNRLKSETKNLECHITLLNMVNEWRFREKKDNCTVYTFLQDTLHLQLVHEDSNSPDADKESEQKVSHITFKFQLDDEKSQSHASLVHKLLSHYFEGESDWVKKYPTSRHVPQLLHDVGLVVSRCRLLGEELHLLKLWGGLRLDIVDISCVDTEVKILFSSLKNSSKFEVILSVSLTDRVCVLQVQSFKNIFGSTTIQQIEEIVASFSPSKKLLTKIVKKIHDDLLC